MPSLKAHIRARLRGREKGDVRNFTEADLRWLCKPGRRAPYRYLVVIGEKGRRVRYTTREKVSLKDAIGLAIAAWRKKQEKLRRLLANITYEKYMIFVILPHGTKVAISENYWGKYRGDDRNWPLIIIHSRVHRRYLHLLR